MITRIATSLVIILVLSIPSFSQATEAEAAVPPADQVENGTLIEFLVDEDHRVIVHVRLDDCHWKDKYHYLEFGGYEDVRSMKSGDRRHFERRWCDVGHPTVPFLRTDVQRYTIFPTKIWEEWAKFHPR